MLLHWFAPPRLARPDLRRRARALWIVSWPFFAVVAVVLSIAVLVEPDTLARRATTVSAVGALVLVLHIISRGGRPLLASWILVVGLSVIVTQRAWITGGIHAPVAVFYALFIVMGGVLIGARAGIATAGVCFIGAIVLTIGTVNGWLTPRPGAGSALGALVFVVLAIGLALVLEALASLRLRTEPEPMGVDAVQMLVHDMRSPMQALIAHLEMLREDIRGESAKDVEGAMSGAAALNQVTNSFLDVSRLEAGRMPVEPVPTDVSVLAQSAVQGLRILQPSRDISVSTHGNSICKCDAELTRRIIQNLVTNAMKHTELEGRVRVVVTGLPGKVAIAVHDEGPGLPNDQRARIFEPYNAPGLRSASGDESSGLGLAFCRLAAEAQDGEIRVSDATPRGSVFIVELPC